MFLHYICENIDILAVMTVRKSNFGFHGNQKTQGHKHQLNNLYFKYKVYLMKLRYLNTFLQFRLLFHEPHCRRLLVSNDLCRLKVCATCHCDQRRGLVPSHTRLGKSWNQPLLWTFSTSNDGCRREEKIHKHKSFFTKFFSSVTENFFIC